MGSCCFSWVSIVELWFTARGEWDRCSSIGLLRDIDGGTVSFLSTKRKQTEKYYINPIFLSADQKMPFYKAKNSWMLILPQT